MTDKCFFKLKHDRLTEQPIMRTGTKMHKTSTKNETVNIFLAVSFGVSPYILLVVSMVLQQIGYVMNYADIVMLMVLLELALAVAALVIAVRSIGNSRYPVLFSSIALLSMLFLLMIAYQAIDFFA